MRIMRIIQGKNKRDFPFPRCYMTQNTPKTCFHCIFKAILYSYFYFTWLRKFLFFQVILPCFMSLIWKNWKNIFLSNKCVDLARFCSKCAFKVVISDFLASPSHSFCTFWQFLLFFRIIRIICEYSRIIVEIIRIFANNEKRE